MPEGKKDAPKPKQTEIREGIIRKGGSLNLPKAPGGTKNPFTAKPTDKGGSKKSGSSSGKK